MNLVNPVNCYACPEKNNFFIGMPEESFGFMKNCGDLYGITGICEESQDFVKFTWICEESQVLVEIHDKLLWGGDS